MDIKNDGLIKTLKNQISETKDLALKTLDNKIDNFVFDKKDFRNGVAAEMGSIALDVVFSKYLPTWSWLAYATQLTFDASPMTLFTIFSKISLEVYH